MNMHQYEAEAKASAMNYVKNKLLRPGHLEKVSQYRHMISRKKASVETLLKSAMQSQLDGVRVGLNRLKTSQQDVRAVEQSIKSLNASFGEIPKLNEKLKEVRQENNRHSQYVTAIENLKHIFTLPESVKKTEQWINEGKLLYAHQLLTDLENSRDDLLFELHKFPNQTPHDKMMLKDYFAVVETQSNLMEKQLKLILGRVLNTVRKEPTVIVTALRIIEREENADAFSLKRHSHTDFMPPGRPKKWRAMAFAVFEEAVTLRIEGTHVDEKENNKMWLVRYLELTRQLILEDLRVIKTLCGPCFPPHYNIVDEFVKMYHTCLSTHLQELIQNGLEGNEYVSLLSWIINTYSGPELMSHPDLNIDTSKIGPLLPQSEITRLQDEYLTNMKNNYLEWMKNTLNSEKMEWQSNAPPEEVEGDGYFRTAAPVIIFQMIDQNLQVTRTISQELTGQALLLSIDQVIKYGHSYRDCIIEFKNKHFEDRNQVTYFTHYMITIVNNCLQLIELASKLKEQYWTPNPQEALGEKFESLIFTYTELRNEAGKFLLEEAFLDLDKHFDELFTPRWLTVISVPSIAVDTICVTLEDYFQDYNHLCESNFEYIITEAESLVAKRYITAMLSKKVSFKSAKESQAASKQVTNEVEKIKSFFSRIAPNVHERNPLDIILLLSEILKYEDSDMLSLDLHKVVKKYPDITEDHLNRLLYLRGDFVRSDMREKVQSVLSTHSNPNNVATIFREIVFPDRMINW